MWLSPRGLLAIVYVVLFSAARVPAPPSIQLHLDKTTCGAPCVITATLAIPQDPDNRLASVLWGYADAESRTWDLAGVRQVEFSAQISFRERGDYTVYAVLLRDHEGQRESFEDSQHVSVH